MKTILASETMEIPEEVTVKVSAKMISVTGPRGTLTRNFDVMIEEEGLTRLLQQNAGLTGDRFFDAMIWDMTEFADGQPFGDDVSGVLLEFSGLNQA